MRGQFVKNNKIFWHVREVKMFHATYCTTANNICKTVTNESLLMLQHVPPFSCFIYTGSRVCINQ